MFKGDKKSNNNLDELYILFTSITLNRFCLRSNSDFIEISDTSSISRSEAHAHSPVCPLRFYGTIDAIGFAKQEIRAVGLQVGVPELELSEGNAEKVFNLGAEVAGFYNIVPVVRMSVYGALKRGFIFRRVGEENALRTHSTCQWFLWG